MTESRVIASMLLGAFMGWLLSPVLWLAFPLPFLLFWRLYATAKAESGFNPNANNPEDEAHPDSVGIFQFQPATWEALTGVDPEDEATDPRTSPFRSAFIACRYIQRALVTDWRWWALMLPTRYGFGLLRVLWTHGTGAWDRYDAEEIAELAEERASSSVNEESLKSEKWPILVNIVLLLLALGMGAAAGRRVRR